MLHQILSVAAISLAPALPTLVLMTEVRAQTTAPAAADGGYVRPAPPGRLVDVGGGRRLHIHCKGSGDGPAVIFEAGLSQYTANTTYGRAQDAIAPFARVCTYDRAGLGWSDPAPAGWTQAGMVADLHRLLEAAEVKGPYILVAHSLGGLLARSYVRAYPGEVAGLVLVDATSDRNFGELEAATAATVPQIDAALASSRPGVPVVGLPPGTSPEVSMAFTPEILRGVKTEFEALGRLPPAMKQPGGFGTLGDLPLIVIRRGKASQPPSEADLNHRAGQEALAALSTDSVLVTAENSGHTIPLDEPQVVADAVRRMIDAVRTKKPLR
ncbi:MAG TPA: alpha/beta hydrolase [Caulobacteraceae bacterium]|nr:alpha/beta hydrolase [Caulobacteraceae bacterium]